MFAIDINDDLLNTFGEVGDSVIDEDEWGVRGNMWLVVGNFLTVEKTFSGSLPEEKG